MVGDSGLQRTLKRTLSLRRYSLTCKHCQFRLSMSCATMNAPKDHVNFLVTVMDASEAMGTCSDCVFGTRISCRTRKLKIGLEKLNFP